MRQEMSSPHLQRLKAVFDNLPDGVVIGDMQGNLLDWNPAALRLHGFVDHEDLRRHVSDVERIFVMRHEGEVIPLDQWPYLRALRGETVLGWEADVERVDLGTSAAVRYDAIPIPDGEGNETLVAIVLHDRSTERRAQTERDQAYELLRAVADSIHDAVVAKDREGRVLFANAVTADQLGRSADALIGSRDADVLDPDLARTITATDDRVIASGRAELNELTRRLGDDDRTFATLSTPLRGADGRIDGVVAVSRDVTEQRRAERSLHASRLQLQQFVEHTPAPVAMFDRNRRYLHCSRRWRIDYQLDEAAIAGRGLDEATPEMPAHWREIHRRGLAGEVLHSDLDSIARPDGSVQWLRWEARPWLGDDGEIGGIIVFSEDITERHLADERLRRSERRFRRLAEAMPSAVLVVTAGAISYCNEAFARLAGADLPAEVIGRSLAELLPDAQTTEARAARGGPFETDLRRLDGAKTPVELVAVALEEDGGPGTLFALHDLTERRRAEQLQHQLHHALKLESLGRLAGGVAHDFNNLLTIISGHCELLLASTDATRPQDGIRAIADASKRAARLTRQLLDFSRTAVVAPRVLDLHEVAKQTLKAFASLLGEDIAIHFDLAAKRAHLRIDPGQIEQVVVNLLVNARDAMPTGGEIVLATRDVAIAAGEHHGNDQVAVLAPGEYVELSIADTGCGMPPEVVARAFDPFFTTKGADKGTGLGLAVVHGIVQQHGGNVGVASRVGVGTTVRVLLPIAKEPTDAEPTVDGAQQRGSETVLVVEDEPGVRAIVRRALQSQGYEVLEAKSGRHAIDLLGDAALRVDLLVTDVVMPDLGGRAVATRARELRPDLCVLYMTGYTDDSVLRHGIARGEPLLQKPFSPAELLRLVRSTLDRRHRGSRKPPNTGT